MKKYMSAQTVPASAASAALAESWRQRGRRPTAAGPRCSSHPYWPLPRPAPPGSRPAVQPWPSLARPRGVVHASARVARSGQAAVASRIAVSLAGQKDPLSRPRVQGGFMSPPPFAVIFKDFARCEGVRGGRHARAAPAAHHLARCTVVACSSVQCMLAVMCVRATLTLLMGSPWWLAAM